MDKLLIRGGRALQGVARSRGQDEQVSGPHLSGRLGGGRFFDDDVRVRAADAETADAGPARRAVRRPLGERRVHVKRTVGKVNTRVGFIEMQTRRDLLMLEGKDGLDQTGNPGGRIQMSDVGLDRTESAKTFPAGAGLESLA